MAHKLCGDRSHEKRRPEKDDGAGREVTRFSSFNFLFFPLIGASTFFWYVYRVLNHPERKEAVLLRKMIKAKLTHTAVGECTSLYTSPVLYLQLLR